MRSKSLLGLIVKNEQQDIAEWLVHHAGLGFDRIVVFDNQSTDETAVVVTELARHLPIDHIRWGDHERSVEGLTKQGAAYAACISDFRSEFDWMCFLDADEFLIPPPGDTILNLLQRFEEASAFALNWQVFGSSGLKSSASRLVMEAFTHRAPNDFDINRHVKMFFRTTDAKAVVNPHFVETTRPALDIWGKVIDWSLPGVTRPDQVIQGDWRLHHYIIRSQTHWEQRVRRRQPGGEAREWNKFKDYDRNDIVDLSALSSARLAHGRLAALGKVYLSVPSSEQLTEPDQTTSIERTSLTSPVLCVINTFSINELRGWAMVPNQVAPTVLDMFVDNQHCRFVTCNTPRPDIQNASVKSLEVGFSITIPNEYIDDDDHVLSFRDANGLPVTILANDTRHTHLDFKFRFTTEVHSCVDAPQQSMLRGWVTCRRSLDGDLITSCDVMVVADNQEIAVVRADRPRPDVAASLMCNSRCGFNLPLPLDYCSTAPKEFRFFLMPERIELIGSPLIATIEHRDDKAGQVISLIERVERLADTIQNMDYEIVKSELRIVRSILEKLMPREGFTTDRYDPWFRQHLRHLRQTASKGKHKTGPLVSVICPVFQPTIEDFRIAVDSVLTQTHENLELILIDDGSNQLALTEVINGYLQSDRRVRVIKNGTNLGISEATNAGLRKAKGVWIAFFDHDDILVDIALERMLAHETTRRVSIIYSDEDKVDQYGFFSEPMFKPQWNYRYLLSVNYINHLTMVKRSALSRIGLLSTHYNGAQDHDFLLRAAEVFTADQIVHVPEVLYHWRKAENSTALLGSTKSYAAEAGVAAIAAHLRRTQRDGRVTAIDGTTRYRVQWDVIPKYRTSIIIPFKDQADLTKLCVERILQHTKLSGLEIVLVDNRSVTCDTQQYLSIVSKNPHVRVMSVDEEFNYSRLNNLAAKTCCSDFFVFMNNDLFIEQDDWLDILIGEADADDTVAIVGGKFVYPDRTIQHGGIILGVGGVAGHAFSHTLSTSSGYGARGIVTHEVSAVTAACMLVRSKVFHEIGGFDEKHLAVAFNDVDLCMRASAVGYRILMSPDFVAEHRESISRGFEDTPEKVERFRTEGNVMINRWGGKITTDPFYNPNFALNGVPFFDLKPFVHSSSRHI
ncbi:glycosyltransferase [Lichenicola cladoniae]|uniref:Glycosyltransferase n=1 Tax=Lichenicola cladoniae TaxID=1484109 RepID=A0A6M8HJJ0_9PROT|nr:glycosyltransferase [Lichenicola cladoniae]NPD68636.1 glycosyltransferase [Acetobacteraceae bacterium]QKE88898.1 glycosyltransferase [Lichenicola cladoniae]